MPDDVVLVSVITAAYNCADTIGATIESVIAQTMPHWEMIIVDDHSSDETSDVVKRYAKSDSRIKFVQLSKNSGSFEARNVAIRCARGRYIAILDSDDLWRPQKLTQQMSFMIAHNYAFTFTAYEIFKNENEKEERKVFSVPQKVNYRQYLRNSIIGCLTVVIDKEQIPDFHMEKGYLEDVLTWMFYLKKGYIAYGLNENLASYRIRITSKSANKTKNAKRYYQCLKEQKLSLFVRIFSWMGYIYNAIRKRLFAKKAKIDDKSI